MTSFLKPNMRNSLLLHFGSWGGRSDGEDARWSSRRDALERGLEFSEVGEDERGECMRLCWRLNMRYRVLRFSHVPPKSRVTTTSGSMKVPTPMVGVEERDVAGAKMTRLCVACCAAP